MITKLCHPCIIMNVSDSASLEDWLYGLSGMNRCHQFISEYEAKYNRKHYFPTAALDVCSGNIQSLNFTFGSQNLVQQQKYQQLRGKTVQFSHRLLFLSWDNGDVWLCQDVQLGEKNYSHVNKQACRPIFAMLPFWSMSNLISLRQFNHIRANWTQTSVITASHFY